MIFYTKIINFIFIIISLINVIAINIKYSLIPQKIDKLVNDTSFNVQSVSKREMGKSKRESKNTSEMSVGLL